MDEVEVERFLAGRLGPGVRAVALLADGAWSRAFAFRDGDRDLVIRFSALDEDFRKDERAAGWANAALPVPPILEIGESQTGFYAISERRFGRDLEASDKAETRAVLPALMAALDAIRLVDVGDTNGYGLWKADGNARSPSWKAALLDAARDHPGQRHHGWLARLAASPTGDGPFFEAFERLQVLADGVPEGRHLIHSDLVNRNVLVEGDRISAVLDWGSAMYGDFLFDLGWITFWAPWYPAWRGIDFAAEASRHYAAIGLPVPDFAERLRACEIFVGLDGQAYQASVGHWAELECTAARTLELARIGPR